MKPVVLYCGDSPETKRINLEKNSSFISFSENGTKLFRHCYIIQASHSIETVKGI